jgi:hypothetical protein
VVVGRASQPWVADALDSGISVCLCKQWKAGVDGRGGMLLRKHNQKKQRHSRPLAWLMPSFMRITAVRCLSKSDSPSSRTMVGNHPEHLYLRIDDNPLFSLIFLFFPLFFFGWLAVCQLFRSPHSRLARSPVVLSPLWLSSACNGNKVIISQSVLAMSLLESSAGSLLPRAPV